MINIKYSKDWHNNDMHIMDTGRIYEEIQHEMKIRHNALQ